MKNRTSIYIVYSLIILGAIGIISTFIYNPTGFIQSIFITVIVIGIIYFLVKNITGNKENRKEQQAFLNAARKSAKRLKQKKEPRNQAMSPKRPIAVRKKSAAHLTVIEGKKGKKKNRALF
ncbi:SA1362 family protein [Bacillus aquiflavi]|uniref:SA1362 family protein n=1 Tax=Bacillus aquiflavi TaxID=2672567 RepID=UPI001FE88C04|nr:SA1362 family protein [Bacillus aquiflavi]